MSAYRDTYDLIIECFHRNTILARLVNTRPRVGSKKDGPRTTPVTPSHLGCPQQLFRTPRDARHQVAAGCAGNVEQVDHLLAGLLDRGVAVDLIERPGHCAPLLRAGADQARAAGQDRRPERRASGNSV